jgi:hypothetical protein
MEEKVVVSTVLRSFRVEAAHRPEDAILEVYLKKIIIYTRNYSDNIWSLGRIGAEAKEWIKDQHF